MNNAKLYNLCCNFKNAQNIVLLVKIRINVWDVLLRLE